MKKAIWMILISTPLWGVQDCTTVDASAYTQEQINLVPALAYKIGYSADNTVQPPTVSQNGKNVTVCFTNPSFSTSAIITIQSLVNQYNLDVAALNAAAAQENAWRVELSTTSAATVAGWQNFGSLNQTQINQGVKNIVRILMLRKNLGLDQW